MGLKWTGERVIPEMMKKGNNPVHQKNLDRILAEHLRRYELAASLVFGRVLDASCGSGYGTEMLTRHADEVLGVDIDQEAINYAEEHYRGNFEAYDLEREFPSKRFDWVVSFETIEHLADPQNFLNSIKERTRYFIFSIPINNPVGEFHKIEYGLDQAKSLINYYFDNVLWLEQAELGRISPFKNGNKYLIGIAQT